MNYLQRIAKAAELTQQQFDAEDRAMKLKDADPFGERCPYCNAQQSLRAIWPDKDYASDFNADCTACGRTFSVLVHQIPEFEVGKLKCCMCNKEITKPHYCAPCLEKLQAISK